MAARKRDAGELIEAFRLLGAREPERWAASQLDEGIPQLHRYAFLAALWRTVEPARARAWVKAIAKGENDMPDEAAAAAIKRMKKLGASDADIAAVVCAARAEHVYVVAEMLDDPDSALETIGYDGGDISWGLFAVDAKGRPGAAIESLHESVGDVGNHG